MQQGSHVWDAAGYLGMAVLGPLFIDTAQPVVLVGGQLGALAVLLAWSRGVSVRIESSGVMYVMKSDL